jgi:hypothetical protein
MFLSCLHSNIQCCIELSKRSNLSYSAVCLWINTTTSEGEWNYNFCKSLIKIELRLYLCDLIVTCGLHSIPQILITCTFHRLIFHGFFSQCTCHGTMQYFLLMSRAEVTIEFCYPSVRLQHTFPQHLLLRATQSLRISPGTPFFFWIFFEFFFIHTS